MKWNDETSCNCFEWGREGVKHWEMIRENLPMYNVSLFGIVTMNALGIMNIS
jgi:hypothetical protein